MTTHGVTGRPARPDEVEPSDDMQEADRANGEPAATDEHGPDESGGDESGHDREADTGDAPGTSHDPRPRLAAEHLPDRDPDPR